MQAISCAYPHHKWEDFEQTVALWTDMLRDLDARAATLAVKRLIASSKWPPSVAEVREAAVENVRHMRMTARPELAWAHVSNAVAWFGTDENKARDYLGETMWGVIARAGGWTAILQDGGKGRFLAVYNAASAVSEHTRQIPESVNRGVEQMVQVLAQRLAIGKGEE